LAKIFKFVGLYVYIYIIKINYLKSIPENIEIHKIGKYGKKIGENRNFHIVSQVKTLSYRDASYKKINYYVLYY